MRYIGAAFGGLEVEGRFAAVADDETDDDGDEEEDGEGDESHKPDGADDDVARLGGDEAVVIDGLFDVDDAEAREVFDVAGDVFGGVWEDKLGVAAFVGVSGEVDFAGEVVFGADYDSGFVVDVAVVVELCGGGDGESGGETWEGVFYNVAIADGFAGYFGVDDAGDFEDVVDLDAGLLLGGLILADDNGGVLGTARGVFGDGDSEVDVFGLVGL